VGETMTRQELTSAKKQTFLNGEVHDWYRIVLGYSDRAVTSALERIQIPQDGIVLDPFCGTGTTLVECMKRGLASVGIDANPSSVFASRVKTHWIREPERLMEMVVGAVYRRYQELVGDAANKQDLTFKYAKSSGLIARGWIGKDVLLQVVALKRAIATAGLTDREADFLKLLLMAELVSGASNVRFGPEAYVVKPRPQIEVWDGFLLRTMRALDDLSRVLVGQKYGRARVLAGDSRDCEKLLKSLRKKPTAVVTSPPYPAEHDYTRNARLELAFLEQLSDIESLRAIKRTMIRSHTKGIYIADDDAAEIARFPSIRALVEEIDSRTAHLDHGFARLYSRVLREYFGGMRRHFRSLHRVLAPRARCAHVVGDQASYMKVHIPTAEILGRVARTEGFDVEGIDTWRGRRSTSTEIDIDERILYLRRRG
jgi:hypothetical protein